MSRLFDDASSEYLESSGVPVTAHPMTISAWFYTDSTAVQGVVCFWNTSSLILRQILLVSAKVRAYEYGNITAGSAITSTSYSTNVWNHAIAIFESSTSRTSFLNAGGEGNNTSDTGDSTDLDNVLIGCQGWTAGRDAYFSGRIAEVGVWDAVVSDAEVAVLAEGYSPMLVRPQNLVSYWPLIRDEDQDRVGGYDMTAYNTPSIAVHPPAIYPVSPIYGIPAAAPGLSIPVAMRHYRNLRET